MMHGEFPGASYDAWKTTEPPSRDPGPEPCPHGETGACAICNGDVPEPRSWRMFTHYVNRAAPMMGIHLVATSTAPDRPLCGAKATPVPRAGMTGFAVACCKCLALTEVP